jgi:hypothetical protein
MSAAYTGEDRRRHNPVRAELEAAVTAAVTKALRDGSLIDGPTHIAHHQAIEEFLQLARHARKTVVGGLVMGVLALVVLGIAVWRS